MEGLQPTFDISGNNGGWGGWGGALIGGAIGGAIGSGIWGGNRGRGGCNDGCCGEQFIMDSLSGLRSDVGSIGRDNLMQTANLQSTMCQGFAGVNATTERVAASIAQNQSRTEAAILTTGYQGQLGAKDNTFALLSAQKDCCCETNRNIERQGCETRAAIHCEGEATRALIAQLDREDLLRKLNKAECKIAALETQQFNVGLAHSTQHHILAGVAHLLADQTAGTTTGAAVVPGA